MKNTSKYLLVLVAALALLGIMAINKPAVAAAATLDKDCKLWHTVKPGEYLSRIAQAYGTDYRTLVQINALTNANVIFPNQKLCVSLVAGTTSILPVATGSASIQATSVTEDVNVTLQGKSLTASTRYTIYLSNEKNNAASSILVGVVTTGKDGDFTVTYKIPKKLIDVPRIKVTIISAKGVALSNWFYNATLEGNTGGINAPQAGIVVESSKLNKWVKIKVTNLPAKLTYQVYIGKEGSKGLNGVLVGTLYVPKSGSASAIFDIPAAYKDRANLDIRLVNEAYSIVQTLTFANKTK
jgi:LysM repeat protein